MDQTLEADNSDDSLIAGLKGLSLGGAYTGDSEAPLSQEETSGRGNPQKSKKKKKKASKQTQGATQQGGLQASPSLSAGQAAQGSTHSTPVLPSSPDGTRKAPFLVSEDGGSTSTELYASEVSDLSSHEEGLSDKNNNNNDKTKTTTDNQMDATGEGAPED